MGKDLESPFVQGVPDWDSLYRARDAEVSPTRPILTGDAFDAIQLPGSTGRVKPRAVAVLQHPCSMRTNGVDLAWQILVAEVKPRRELDEHEWANGHYNLMPLPHLRTGNASGTQDHAICFDNLYLVKPSALTTRIAVLSPFGVNLLLQRWVHFNSRVVVPTQEFQKESSAYYEEADLIEEWCDEAPVSDLHAATKDCLDWLRTDRNGSTFQERLKDPQARSTIRKAMRAEIRSRRGQS